MHLDSMIATNAFTEKDLQIFGGIGGQAAVAIHNSQLARKIEHEAKTRAQFQRLLSPNLVDQVVQGKLQLEKGGALSEVTLLFSDIRGFTSMSESRAPRRDRPHAQRVLRADGRRDLQVRGHAGQVRRRRDHRAVRRARADEERRGQGGAVRAGHDAGAVGVQPHPRRRRPARDQDRHRHQHRHRGHGRDRQLARAPVHGDRRRGEHRRRACAASRSRARSSSPRRPSARSRPTSPPCRCRPCASRARPTSCASTTPSACATAPSRPRTPARARTTRMGFVAAVAKLLALLIAAAAALAAALIVLPAPSQKMALAAIVASEKSALIAAAAVVALPLAFFGFTRGRRAPVRRSRSCSRSPPIGMCILPLAQARSLAKARGVSLDIGRYLQAPHRHRGPGPSRPDRQPRDRERDAAGARRLPAARSGRRRPGRPVLVVHGGFWSAGREGRGDAREPAPRRPRVHGVRRPVPDHAAAELADRDRRREVRDRLGQAARRHARLERRPEEGDAAGTFGGRPPGADGRLRAGGSGAARELRRRRHHASTP